MLRRRGAMDRLKYTLVLLRSCYRQHVWVHGVDLFRLRAHTAGDNDFAVLRERGADGGERFRLRAIEKAAGIDDGEIGIRMVAGKLVTLGAQPRDDALGIDQGLWAAEGY